MGFIFKHPTTLINDFLFFASTFVEKREGIEAMATDFEMDDFDVEQGHDLDASLLRSRFDTITTKRPSLNWGKRKKWTILLATLVSLWIVGTLVYLTGGADKVVDYYHGNTTIPDADANAVPTVETNPEDDNLSRPSEEQETTPGALPDTVEKSKLPISLTDLRSGRLSVYSTPVHFLAPPAHLSVDEGLYYYVDRSTTVAKKSTDNEWSKILLESHSFEYDSVTYKVAQIHPNFDLTWAIIASDLDKEFRHSSHGYYWLYNIESKQVTPLTSDDKGELVKLSFANWSPMYNYISFVKNNDLFVKSIDAIIQRVTEDGSDQLLNAKTDWIYEEEVLADDKAVWWSPDEKTLIYMKTSETGVPQYNIDLYTQDQGGATRYPVSQKISYPKPGFKNPQVSLHAYNIEARLTLEIPRDGSTLGDEHIVYEVFYVGGDDVLIKETDRESNILNLRHFKPSTAASEVIHTVDANAEYNGWIEKFNPPLIIPTSETRPSLGYVDTYVVSGYYHLCYSDTPTSKPKPLTSGDWEVSMGELAFDSDKDLVYFSAAKTSSVDKHLYSVHLATGEISAITDDSQQGHYGSNFSPNAKFVALFKEGPGIQSMELIKMEDQSIVAPYSQQEIYIQAQAKFAFPDRKFHRVEVDHYDDETPVTLNVLEYLPHNFDPKKKYPLLVHYYGGPGSQVVKSSVGLDFEDVVSSSLDAIVLFIEPRGTGGQGWRFRSWGNKHIGYWEPRDIVKVSQMWIDKGFIDTAKTAVWGWSYGGFVTLKTLEYDQGKTFRYGMAVAPVTDWLLYDSIYTERYMDKPENNKNGYEVSKINDVLNLGQVDRFLVMHGTADDNVHIQNTYGLLDLLTLHSVENYDVHVFPDSEHSIYYHNANPVVYDKLFNWLKDAFEGDLKALGHN